MHHHAHVQTCLLSQIMDRITTAPHPPAIIPFFFFNDPPPPEISTLPLHDALPIFLLRAERAPVRQAPRAHRRFGRPPHQVRDPGRRELRLPGSRHGLSSPVAAVLVDQDLELDADRKSTRLNSSHVRISYAVFCLSE